MAVSVCKKQGEHRNINLVVGLCTILCIITMFHFIRPCSQMSPCPGISFLTSVSEKRHCSVMLQRLNENHEILSFGKEVVHYKVHTMFHVFVILTLSNVFVMFIRHASLSESILFEPLTDIFRTAFPRALQSGYIQTIQMNFSDMYFS